MLAQRSRNVNPHQTVHQPRRKTTLVQIILLSTLLIACALGIESSTAQSSAQDNGVTAATEREVENTIPAHLPIKVKVKNPEKVKDLKNDNWLGDLEIEVKNTGTKPIYLLILSLHLPDVKGQAAGSIVGFQLWQGRTELGDFKAPVQSDDVPIRPGESQVIRVPENKVRGWKLYKAQKNFPNPKKIKLNILLINFGDGTGFSGPDGVPENRTKQGTNAPCPEGDARPNGSVDATSSNRPPNLSPKPAFLSLPVSLLPANFSWAKANRSPSPTLTQTCCPGTSPDCFRRTEQTNNCFCGPVRVATSASCAEPGGRCATAVFVEESCTDSYNNLLQCDHYEMGTSCATTSPFPTPTPEPTPTPTPTPEPTPLPCTEESPNPSCCQCVPVVVPPGSGPAPSRWTCSGCETGTPLSNGCLVSDSFGNCPDGYAWTADKGGTCCPLSANNCDQQAMAECYNMWTWTWNNAGCTCECREVNGCYNPHRARRARRRL